MVIQGVSRSLWQRDALKPSGTAWQDVALKLVSPVLTYVSIDILEGMLDAQNTRRRGKIYVGEH